MDRIDDLIWSAGILEGTIRRFGEKPEWVKELEDINAEIEVLVDEEYAKLPPEMQEEIKDEHKRYAEGDWYEPERFW